MDEKKKTKTTIPMGKITRDRVKSYGKKGESWDALQNRMMDTIESLKSENDDLKAMIESLKVKGV